MGGAQPPTSTVWPESHPWLSENLLNTIAYGATTESFTYDADGERVAKTVGSTTTVYFAGLWEQVVGGARKLYYVFNGQVVALRGGASGLAYLHGDHLGSVSVVSKANSAALLSQQEFDPWGKVRSGSVISTTLNYTGQRLDGSGLLYYHARMYNPVIGRFVSADSVVPGSASGSMAGVALRPLTVDFHEVGFVNGVNSENQQPFWFQMSNDQQQQAGSPWGPSNPQALNRYSYVLNNPVRYTDPGGHTLYLSTEEAEIFSDYLSATADEIEGIARPGRRAGLLALAVKKFPVLAGILSVIGKISNLAMVDVAILRKLAIMIDEANEGHSQGVAFATYHDEWGGYYAAALNRNTGIATSYAIGWSFAVRYEQTEWELGWAVNYTEGGSSFIVDLNNSGRSFDRPLDYRENCGIHANCPQP